MVASGPFLFLPFGFTAVFSGGNGPTIDKTISVGCKGEISVGVFDQPINLAPEFQLAAGITVLDAPDGGLPRLDYAILRQYLFQGDLL